MKTLRQCLIGILLILNTTCSTGTIEGEMTIKSGYQRTYTTTITRAVGPTTLTSARGTLPQPTPTDSNSVFVAPNGSDAGADGSAATGTFAAPVLTLAKVLTVIAAQPSRPTGVIIRNGYVGELLFTISGTTAFGANNLQAAEGEIGIVQSNVLTTKRTLSVSTGRMNGIISRSVTFTGTSTGGFDNCGVDTRYIGSFFFSNGANTSTANYCYGEFEWSPSALGSTNTLTNCILLQQTGTSGTTRGSQVMTMTGNSNGAGTFTSNMVRCLLFQTVLNPGDENPYILSVKDNGDAAARTFTINISSSMISTNMPTFVGYVMLNTGKTIAITETNCLHLGNETAYQEDISPASATYTFTTANALPKTLPPLLVNGTALGADLPTDPYNGSLQVFGKSTPNGSGRYFVDSPLIGAGVAGVDVNPWDETTVFVSAAYTDTFVLAEEFEPTAMELAVEPINPTLTVDTLGNIHPYHDTLRRRFQFSWADNAVIAPDLIRQFVKMLGSKGTKQFYPLDETGDLWDGTGTAQGAFVPSTATANATLSPLLLTPMLIERNWQGWICEVTVASVTYDYYIESNSDDTFSLVNKQGFTEPAAGNHTFAIRKMTVANEQAPIVFSQKMFTRFQLGGKWRETEEPETSNNYAYVMPSLTLIEVEDDEESA